MRRVLAVFLMLVLNQATLPTVALGAPPAKDAGKSVADDAAVAFKEQRFQEAAELFEKAYALGNDKFVRLRNAGRAWEEAGKLEYARTQFQKYLDKVPTGPDHDEVVERLARLEARIAQKPATKTESPVVQAPVDVAAPASARVEPDAPVARVEQPASASQSWVGWTLIGGGAALVAGGTAWLVMTESANARLRDESAAGRYTLEKLAHDQSVIAQNRVMAASVATVGVAGIVVGAILAVRSGAPSSTAVSALVTPNGAVVGWSGRF